MLGKQFKSMLSSGLTLVTGSFICRTVCDCTVNMVLLTDKGEETHSKCYITGNIKPHYQFDIQCWPWHCNCCFEKCKRMKGRGFFFSHSHKLFCINSTVFGGLSHTSKWSIYPSIFYLNRLYCSGSQEAGPYPSIYLVTGCHSVTGLTHTDGNTSIHTQRMGDVRASTSPHVHVLGLSVETAAPGGKPHKIK